MYLDMDITKKMGSFRLKIALQGELKSRIGLLGASGAGKSMTLKCIAGIEKPDAGHIRLGERVLFDSERKLFLPPRKRKIGYLFQNYALFPHMTIEENIGLAMPEKDKEKRAAVISGLLESFQLAGMEKRLPGQISGGQQQRVALARILASEPDMILLDEPFSALDSHLREGMERLLRESLSGYNGPVLYVSHSRDEMFRLTEQVCVLQQGVGVHFAPTGEVFENPTVREAALLTGCKNISKIEKKDAHTVYVPEWQMTLTTSQEVTEDIAYVAIRAHHIKAATGSENCNVYPAEVLTLQEMPFHFDVTVRIKGTPGEGLWMKLSKTSAQPVKDAPFHQPDAIYLPPEKLLLLQE